MTAQAAWDNWTAAHERMWAARARVARAAWPELAAARAEAETAARESQAAETAWVVASQRRGE